MPTPCVAPHYLQIAAALQAEKLILMTDVPGVLKDKDDVATKYAALDIRSVRELVREGIIAGGMIPKVGAGGGWGAARGDGWLTCLVHGGARRAWVVAAWVVAAWVVAAWVGGG